MASLSLKNLNKIYDNNVQAVFDFNIDIEDDGAISITGGQRLARCNTIHIDGNVVAGEAG